jgi:hypothetical protein
MGMLCCGWPWKMLGREEEFCWSFVIICVNALWKSKCIYLRWFFGWINDFHNWVNIVGSMGWNNWVESCEIIY